MIVGLILIFCFPIGYTTGMHSIFADIWHGGCLQ